VSVSDRLKDLSHLFQQLQRLVWFLNKSGQALALEQIDGFLLSVSAGEDNFHPRPDGPDFPKDFFAGQIRHGQIQ